MANVNWRWLILLPALVAAFACTRVTRVVFDLDEESIVGFIWGWAWTMPAMFWAQDR